MPKPEPKPVTPKDKTSLPAPATIVVSLPADAKLTIDDAATTSTSTTRVFVSPTLPAGKEYHYVLKAEIVREGRTITCTETVPVSAGEQARVTMQFPVATVASK
jgi:uncharacterized protein (TIGR03000 family)